MGDYDYDYDETVDDRVFPHPWERVFDEDKNCEVPLEIEMQIEHEIAMQKLAAMHPTRKTHTRDSSRNIVLCSDLLFVLGTDEEEKNSCTQVPSCRCSHGCT